MKKKFLLGQSQLLNLKYPSFIETVQITYFKTEKRQANYFESFEKYIRKKETK